MAQVTKASEQAVSRYNHMQGGNRSTYDSHCQDAARFCYPEANRFHQPPGSHAQWEKKNQRIYSSTAVTGLQRFSAAIESLLTPRNSVWHKAQDRNPALSDNGEVKQWLSLVNDIIYRRRYAPNANFQSQANMFYMSLGAFGTAAMFIDESPNDGIRYKTCFIGDIFLAENHQGLVDTVYRRFWFTHKQAVQQWGEDAPKVAKEQVGKSPDNGMLYLHCVQPNEDMDDRRDDAEGMPFKSMYVCLESMEELETGGYRSMPYAISRYIVAPHEAPYGRSPAMQALADIRTLNDMERTQIRAGHKIVDPSLLMADDGGVGGGLMSVDLDPGGITTGGLSSNGTPLIAPLQTGARPDLNERMMEKKEMSINDAFLVSLFDILVQSPQMTATQATIRAQEKGALIAPTVGRQESEFLGPLIEREIDLAIQAGDVPPPPDIMIQAGGFDPDVTYESPLTRLARSEELAGIQRTLEMATQIAQVEPQVFDALDLDEMIREFADGAGAPAKTINTRAEVARTRSARAQAEQQAAQAEQAAQLAGALPDIADASLKSAQAQQIRGA